MFRRKNLRALGVDFSVANADLIDPVHQLRDQIKIETGAAECRNVLLRRDNDVRIFNCVVEVVTGHDGRYGRLASATADFKDESGAAKLARPELRSTNVEGRTNDDAQML